MDIRAIKKNLFYCLMLILVTTPFVFSSCSAKLRKAAVYNMSYDKTYLTALSAIDEVPNWHPLETDQVNGIIRAERTGFLYPNQEVSVMVKRLGPFRTKVEVIDRDYKVFTGLFFDAIDKKTETTALTYPS